jgi:trans-aconitate methyltransferase
MSDRAESGNRWDASLYDDKHSFVWKHGASLLELLAPRPGERILDLGCGTGHLTAQIAAGGADVTGVDSSTAMIEQARHGYPHLRFEVADARDFVFAESFDAVFSNAVLHWIREPARVIGCVRRALKPGGRFVAEFGGKGNVQVIAGALEAAFREVGSEPFELPWYFPSIAEYTALLEQGGLEVTFATLFDRPTPLDGEDGMRNWIAMFANDLLARVPEDRREGFLRIAEERLRPVLHRDGTWLADYRRLRVVARRVQ